MVENARSYFMIGNIALKSKEGPCFLLDPREMDGGPYLQVSLRERKQGMFTRQVEGQKKKSTNNKKKNLEYIIFFLLLLILVVLN